MKKIALVLLALVGLSGLAFSEDFSKSGMLLSPGTLDVNAGLSYGWYYGVGVGVGAEYVIGKFDVAKDIPLSYGAAARAAINFGYFDSTPVVVGAFGTLHFNWGALDIKGADWLKNLASYIGLGLDIIPGATIPVQFDSIGGVSYFIQKNLAVNLESGVSGSKIGVLYKF
jgi:hypothetical protein